MNWKMTAKTILVQLHHKVQTLEHVGKHFVLVVQDCLLEYFRRQFHFDHLTNVRIGDPMHIHAYAMDEVEGRFQVELVSRLSTDAAGVAKCLGIQAEMKIELDTIVAEIEKKIGPTTRLTVDAPLPNGDVSPVE
jgi:hypothetical protein